jgi:alkylation response protein AidB-like acyl-CoA dehydrogenase
MRDKAAETPLFDAACLLRSRILAERDKIESSRRLPEPLARDLARAGFFRMSLPEAYGGLDLAPVQALLVLEELARADASVAWCVWNGNTHWVTTRLAADVAHAIHTDPAVITANSTRASGHAEPVAGGYHVTGRWSLVSGCELGTWMVLLCRVPDGGTRFAICRSEDCQIIDTWTVGGLRGTGSHDVSVSDLFVPVEYTAAFTDPLLPPEVKYRLPPFSRVIPGLGVMALGIARTAIETFIEIAVGKTPERASQRLCNNHDAQTRLSRAESLVRAARLLLLDSVERQWTMLLDSGDVTMESRAGVRLAASHAVASATDAIDLLYRGAGATSLYTSCPLERAFRDVHAIAQHIGVHARVMETTGRVLFGLETDTPLL